jgi:hypothetical protein
MKRISPINATRLGLDLSQAVWSYEIENNAKKACRIAKEVILPLFLI